MNEKEKLETKIEITKDIAKDVYNDAGKPVVKSTGELVGLIPRAIKAALSPLEKWILEKEYNVAETKKLLEEKLQNIQPEFIEPPAAHIAVPAIQYISYCMDNKELRDMYANLLANSMNKVVKNGVHPSFIEIIKQLSPDEAKILKYIYDNPFIPTIQPLAHKKTGKSVLALKLFTNITELCNCENIGGYNEYIDNLIRLGLVNLIKDEAFEDKNKYITLKNHPYILEKKHYFENLDYVSKVTFKEGHLELSSFGQSFCSICLNTQIAQNIVES